MCHESFRNQIYTILMLFNIHCCIIYMLFYLDINTKFMLYSILGQEVYLKTEGGPL